MRKICMGIAALGLVAAALFARKLVFISDVPGILADKEDESSVINTNRTDEIDGLIRRKVLSGGMLPKIAGCVSALQAGSQRFFVRHGQEGLHIEQFDIQHGNRSFLMYI